MIDDGGPGGDRSGRENAAQHAYRQRERLQQDAAALRAELDERQRRIRALTREVADLKAATRGPGYRMDAVLRRLVRAVRSMAGGGRTVVVGPGATGDVGGPSPVSPATSAENAATYRGRMRSALAPTARGAPLRVVVLAPPGGDAHDADATALRRVADASAARLGEAGFDAVVLDRPESSTMPPDVLVVMGPRVEVAALPAAAVRVAWLGDDRGAWPAGEELDDADLVLVPDEEARSKIMRLTSKQPHVAGSPGVEGSGVVLREHLRAWVEAPKVAIHIPPLNRKAAPFWGDTPFGRGVQKAMERRGWPATLHVHAERDSAAAIRADAAVHVFGLRAPERRRDQPTLLWIISHPDLVTRQLATSYDVVAVASDDFLDDLRQWLGDDAPPLLALHQATDPERFYPEPGGPVHDLLFVGSGRRVRRPMLDHLAGTPHDLAVYGRNWDPDVLDPRYLRGEWIPNEELHRYYASARIVLSEYWRDMREEGFIANRTYDALAAGAFVLSEAMAGLQREFDGGVATFVGREDLLRQVDAYLRDPDERARIAERGRRAVLARHTFDHRAATLIEALAPRIGPRSSGPGPAEPRREAGQP